MDVFRNSILKKLVFHLVWFLALIAAIGFLFFYSDTKSIPYLYFIIVLFVFLAFFAGVVYIDIVKPLKSVMSELQLLLSGKPYKRIYTNRIDEIGIIAHFFNKMTEGLHEVSFDLKDRERMMDELSIASSLQRDILPLESQNVPGLQIVAKNRPATEVGGDSFNMLSVNDKTYIYIGDVTGHGVAAGLIMTMVYSLVSVFAEKEKSAYDIVFNVNKYIKKHIKKTMFMTMVMLCFDHKTKKLTYVGAGHEHILVYRPDSGECEKILSGGIALGMVPDNSKIIKEKEINLRDGDYVILFSDGIVEARNQDGELFGLQRLITSIKEHASSYSAEGVNFHVAKDVSDFMRGHKQDDDMTLIVLKRDDKMESDTLDKTQSTKW